MSLKVEDTAVSNHLKKSSSRKLLQRVKSATTNLPDINAYPPQTGYISPSSLTVYLPEMKIAKFANSVDFDQVQVAHNEPPHLDLHCLPSCL